MNCAEIMDKKPVVLQTEDTIGTAIDTLLKHRLLALPVVDANGIYQGMFAKSRLFGLLFPVLGSVEELLPQMAMLTNIGAAPDKLGEIKERLRSLSDALVGTYADKTVPTLAPQSSIIAAILLVYRVRNFVAVVDPDTQKLLGVVSTWDALAKLRE
jgi:CBS-domain-containing membrane protein